MFNPADLTPERIQALAQKMQDPALRQKAAYHLASTVGPAPDEQDQIQQMMQPQGQPQGQATPQPQAPQVQANPAAFPGQGQIPQSGMMPPPSMDQQIPSDIQQGLDAQIMEQMAHQQAQEQERQKMQEAQMYDQLGLTGAQPGDIWGKAAIYNEFIMQQQSLQKQMMPQGQQQSPSMPQLQTEPVPARQGTGAQVPQEDYLKYIGGY